MEYRPATTDDIDGIRRVAAAALESSYASLLDSEAIESLLANRFSQSSLEEELERRLSVVTVAVNDDEVVGFTQAERVPRDEEGKILWLLVHPDARNQGVGSNLFERTRERLLDAGASKITAEVLAEHEAGTTFYTNRNFVPGTERAITIGNHQYNEVQLVESTVTPATSVPFTTHDGNTVYIDQEHDERGVEAPFYPVYTDEDHTDLYGWYCSECDSIDVSMDTMGTVECNNCGNRRKPPRWDAAYL